MQDIQPIIGTFALMTHPSSRRNHPQAVSRIQEFGTNARSHINSSHPTQLLHDTALTLAQVPTPHSPFFL